MELHRAAGHRVYLVSASPEEIVLPLADLLGVDGAICSRGEVDEQGCYTGRMAFYAYGDSKATAMRELAAAHRASISAASSAYSDSAHRSPHARGGRASGGGQPRPRPRQSGARARLGGAQLHRSRSASATGSAARRRW